MRSLLWLFLFFIIHTSIAQVFTVGDVNHFNKVDGFYQLNGLETGGESKVCFMPHPGDSVFIKGTIMMKFAPSASNFVDVILAMDTLSKNRLFLRLGENGSDDTPRLYKDESGKITELIHGDLGIIAKELDSIRFEVWIKNNVLNMKIATNIDDFKSYETKIDLLFNSENTVLGIETNYTSTRSTLIFFRFDAFYFHDLAKRKSFLLENISVLKGEIVFLFNDDLSDVYLDFGADSIIVKDSSVHFLMRNIQNDLVVFDSLMICKNEDCITVDTSLFYQIVDVHDLIISELMVNSSGNIFYDNAEYIELFNNSKNIINLGELILKVDTKEFELPKVVLQPNNYFLCTNKPLRGFDLREDVFYLSGFTLNNSTGKILLIDKMDDMIDSVYYSKEETPSVMKTGYSQERDLNLCHTGSQWLLNQDHTGGSPLTNGYVPKYKNSPLLLWEESDNGFEVFFEHEIENVYKINVGDKVFENYSIVDNSLFIDSISSFLNLEFFGVKICGFDKTDLILTLGAVKPHISFGDLIISEAMFDPQTSCSEFVEIFNPTDSFIDLNQILFSNSGWNVFQQPIANYKLKPKGIFVLIDDASSIVSCYTIDNIHSQEYSMSLNNEQGELMLYDLAGVLVDQKTYVADDHSSLLNDHRGVSYDFLKASSSVFPEYHTLGFVETKEVLSEIGFSVSPSYISPNGDGYNDFFEISIKEDDVAKLSLFLFNEQGVLIDVLINDELVDQDFIFEWDGQTTKQVKLPSGVYQLTALIKKNAKESVKFVNVVIDSID